MSPAKTTPSSRKRVLSFATGGVRTSPLARRYATSRGLDPALLTGSGPGGRVVLRDVAAALRDGIDRQKAPRHEQREEVPRDDHREAAAELTLHLSADASRLVQFAEDDTPPGPFRVADLVLFVVARTLPRHPAINAHFLETVIRRYSEVDLGVLREDTGQGDRGDAGSFTIPRADAATITHFSRLLRGPRPEPWPPEDDATHSRERVGERQALPVGVRRATFTCAVFEEEGPDLYTPLLIPPQVGLLGIGPVKAGYGRSGTAGPRINLSLTIDHRALDGAPATRFLEELVRRLEAFDPVLV